MKTFFKYKIEIIVFTLSVVVGFILFKFGNMRFPNDDQFILYRYVDNIISGNGFVFNVGEKILGSTTPLFTIVSSFFALLFKSVYIPNVIAYLNIVFLGLTSVYLFKIAKFFEIDNRFSYILIAIFSFNMSKMIPEGMETPMFLFFVLATVYYALIDKKYTSAIFLALTLLTRPDALLVGLVMFIYWTMNHGLKEAVKLSILSFVVLIPWLIFSTIYFGSFVPQSLLAKLHSEDIVRMPFYQAFKVQLASLSRIYWGSIIDFQKIPLQVLINLLPILYFIFISVKNYFNKKNWIIFLIPLLYFISFSISNPIMFPWYISQMEPFWLLISFLGIYHLYKNNYSKYYSIFIVLILCISFLSFVNRVTNPDMGSKNHLFSAGQYLKDRIQPNDSIGISNIGIVAFETKAKIVDFFGLVKEDAFLYYPIKNGCFDKNELYVIPPDLIKASTPEWLVFGDNEMDDCFKNSLWFNKNYTQKFRTGDFYIYKIKKDVR